MRPVLYSRLEVGHVLVKDTVIRNVTTDILRYMNIPDGNSIFIFEVSGLCIGHLLLGTLHSRLFNRESFGGRLFRADQCRLSVTS